MSTSSIKRAEQGMRGLSDFSPHATQQAQQAVSAPGEGTKRAHGVAIRLTKGKITFVDAIDAPHVRQFKWSATLTKRGKWYAKRKVMVNGRGTSQMLHRFLMAAPPVMDVDHKDGDGLNNRRSTNLRLATRSQNTAAMLKTKVGKKSRFRGVGREGTAWRATITVRNERVRLGRFSREEDAAHAYDEAALLHFGEFARLNFPPPLPGAQP